MDNNTTIFNVKELRQELILMTINEVVEALEFKGYMEHSVIIDLNKNVVLDFAHNIMVPLKIWFKFLGEPNLLIDGKSYQELVKQAKGELDVDLNICLLEQVRRRTK